MLSALTPIQAPTNIENAVMHSMQEESNLIADHSLRDFSEVATNQAEGEVSP